MIRFSHSRTVAESLREYGQGIAGGPMFSIPLFYTLEMWNSGSIMEPWRILLLYNRYVGLRRDATFAEVAIGSVGEMGTGFFSPPDCSPSPASSGKTGTSASPASP